jgi:transglutaminase-like putative cysteine protease
MRYLVTHTTCHDYQAEVSASHHVARLSPRPVAGQSCLSHTLTISPQPARMETRRDYFGNEATFFSVETPFRKLSVTATSLIELEEAHLELDLSSCAWEDAREIVRAAPCESPAGLALEFTYASPLIPLNPAFSDYALPSFAPGRPMLEACEDLMRRIHTDFTFSPATTTISTPLLEVLRTRRGVCQDYAQVYIACLRSLGLAARYVSGYIETLPPPGQPKLVGADASHAWVSVYCPPLGWFDFDPTNNTRPRGQHITIGWGRDFTDISPLRGVFLGSGSHELHVSVDVNRITDSAH